MLKTVGIKEEDDTVAHDDLPPNFDCSPISLFGINMRFTTKTVIKTTSAPCFVRTRAYKQRIRELSIH